MCNLKCSCSLIKNVKRNRLLQQPELEAGKSKITIEINDIPLFRLAYLIMISTFNIINEILLFVLFSSGIYFTLKTLNSDKPSFKSSSHICPAALCWTVQLQNVVEKLREEACFLGDKR